MLLLACILLLIRILRWIDKVLQIDVQEPLTRRPRNQWRGGCESLTEQEPRAYSNFQSWRDTPCPVASDHITIRVPEAARQAEEPPVEEEAQREELAPPYEPPPSYLESLYLLFS